MEILRDVVYCGDKTKESIMMRKCVEKIIEENPVMTNMQVLGEPTPSVFNTLMDEVFQKTNINWGRIIMMYSVAKVMCDNIKDEKEKDEFVSEIGFALENKIGWWVKKNGDWKYLTKQEGPSIYQSIVIIAILFIALAWW